MKDAEDEAFDAIEKAQGWRKRQIAEQKEKPMTKDEALKLALEALEVIYDRAVFDYSLPADHFAAEGAQEAITAIKEALAQPEQTPVAWLYIEPNNPHLNIHYGDVDVSQFPHDEWFPVYKSPPQHEWVGLTDEEMKELWENKGWYVTMFKAVEAKLKEKNT